MDLAVVAMAGEAAARAEVGWEAVARVVVMGVVVTEVVARVVARVVVATAVASRNAQGSGTGSGTPSRRLYRQTGTQALLVPYGRDLEPICRWAQRSPHLQD